MEIVGVIADGSQLLGFSSAYLGTEDSIKEKPDFRDLYANVNKHGNMMLIVPTDCLKDINCKIYPCGNQIVTLKDNVSNERFKELELYLRDYGRVLTLRISEKIRLSILMVSLSSLFQCLYA